MIPIGIQLEQKRTPWVNYALVAANVLLFFGTLANEPLKNRLALPARDLQPFADEVFFRDLVLFTLASKELEPQQKEAMRKTIEHIGPRAMEHLRAVAAAPASPDRKIAELRRFTQQFATARTRQQYVVEGHGFQTGGVWARPWTLVTHGFMHAGWMHIIGNMIFLWLFGNALNNRLGHVGHAAGYLVFLIAAGLAHYYLSNAPAVGASGAIAGVTGACLVYYPLVRVDLLVPIFYIYHRLRLPILYVVGFEFAYNIWQQFSGAETGVAYWAHIGGYVSGFAIALLLVACRITPWRGGPLDLVKWLQQRARARQLREAQQPYGPQGHPYAPRRPRDDGGFWD